MTLATPRRSLTRSLFTALFGLAALGVGVWLFRSRRARRGRGVGLKS
jgi:hypothetical protein